MDGYTPLRQQDLPTNQIKEIEQVGAGDAEEAV
jgi:hypothetical protein